MRSAATPAKVSPTHAGGLEISQYKKMLKMKSPPQSLLKTKGQKKSSSEFDENKGVVTISLLLYDTQGVSSDFHTDGQCRCALTADVAVHLMRERPV
jgi:hypothetical protein